MDKMGSERRNKHRPWPPEVWFGGETNLHWMSFLILSLPNPTIKTGETLEYYQWISVPLSVDSDSYEDISKIKLTLHVYKISTLNCYSVLNRTYMVTTLTYMRWLGIMKPAWNVKKIMKFCSKLTYFFLNLIIQKHWSLNRNYIEINLSKSMNILCNPEYQYFVVYKFCMDN